MIHKVGYPSSINNAKVNKYMFSPKRKSKVAAAILASCIMLSGNSHAALAVIDFPGLAQHIKQVQSWQQQYTQMVQQLTQLEKQVKGASGIRNMAGLVNNPLLRNYLPKEYKDILTQGVGQWEAIRNSAKVFGIEQTSLNLASGAAKAFLSDAKQTAINRAQSDEALRSASERFADIQVLLDKVNDAPDQKDIADLSARIQVESVMMQNEANKLIALQAAANAQRDLQNQRNKELSMKSTRGGLPSGW